MRVRQSALKAFGDCAYQYKLLQTEGAEEKVGSLTVLGTVFHYAAEVYDYYGDLELAKRTFDKYWAIPEALGERIDFWHRGSNFDSLTKRGHMMLESYAQQSLYKGKPLEAEAYFIVPIGEHELEGTIDRLYLRPGQHKVEIVDLKTAAKVPEKLRFNIQFTAYCYATTTPEFWEQIERPELYEKLKDWKRGGQWYHARNGKIFEAGYREERDYNRLLVAIEQMASAIENDVYPLTISGDACGYCPFVETLCGA